MGKVLAALHTKMASAKRLEKIAGAKNMIKVADAFKTVIGVLEKTAISPEAMRALKYYGARLGAPAAGGAITGAGIGAIAGGEGHRMEGAAKGAVGGALGTVGASELTRLLAAKGLLGNTMRHTTGMADDLARARAGTAEGFEAAVHKNFGDVVGGKAMPTKRDIPGIAAGVALPLAGTVAGGVAGGRSAAKKPAAKPAEKKEPKEEKSEDSEE